MWFIKRKKEKTQYEGDIVMFLANKIIQNKKLNYHQKNVALHIVLKPYARPPKQLMVLLYMVHEGFANGFKTMCKAS